MTARVLVVEDDRIIADGLKLALSREGYDVTLAFDGDAGLHAARSERPDLIVLDIMVPYMNGFELTTELRRLGDDVPIIVLSARVAVKDRVRGLDLGVDDYMTKPFEIDELIARIRRRLGARKATATEFGGCRFDWEARTLTGAGGEAVALSARELLLLEFILKRPNRIVSRAQIIEAVWGDEYDGTDRTVDNFIMQLRRKIGAEHLVTMRGQGYRFVPEKKVTS